MAPVRIGVVGCGAIAQIQHLPNLSELQDEFEVAAVCDCSPALARAVAAQFGIPAHLSDYRDLLASDLDAVILCHSDPKTEVAVASLEAGMHTFIEKPLCWTLADADAIVDAARSFGGTCQVGYMKVYDPAFELARREVQAMEGSVRFIQVNHLHTDNSHHLAHFRLQRFDDIPESVRSAQRDARRAAVAEALGDVSDTATSAFFHLAGSMIHDLYGLRALFGQPQRVVSTEIWNGGLGITALLEYGSGARCAATWVELRDIRQFAETLEVYGDDRGIVLSYPTGFSRGILSTLTVKGVDAEGRAFSTHPEIEWENPFRRELAHFHSCITEGVKCRTPVEDARQDVALIIDIVRRYLATA
jgi:predicted dehydrogenase